LRAAKLGLEMIAITQRLGEKYGTPLEIRVGVHSGSLVAGVIGKKCYTYDMWGESVNLASRMETSGMANRVQVSESAYQRLVGYFRFEARGEIDVRGMGHVMAYLISAEVEAAD
jgi:adenylate cyclase